MRRWLPIVPALLLASALTAQTAAPAGEETAPPEDPSKISFMEYDPPSTLVVPEHPVTRAKFPFVDVHSHLFGLDEARIAEVVAAMDAMNMGAIVNLSGRGFVRTEQPDGTMRYSVGPQQNLRDAIEMTERFAPGRIVHFTNVDFEGVGTPGWAERAVAELEEDVAAGAKGLKIYKSLGMDILDSDGERLAVNDPRLRPVWEACGRLGVPVLIHTAEPKSFWDPLDGTNERLYEMIEIPGRWRNPEENDSWETLIAEQHDLFRSNPGTTFINAHLGWLGNDLAALGELLDSAPNVHTEIGAVLAELGRQPRFAHDWLNRYKDRVLFGKDSFRPDEFPYYFRTLETRDDYFPYYRRRHAFWRLYGLDLPDDVLRALYYENALRIVPGLPRDRFPAPTEP